MPQDPSLLSYERIEPDNAPRQRPKWVYILIAVYAAILFILATSVIWLPS